MLVSFNPYINNINYRQKPSFKGLPSWVSENATGARKFLTQTLYENTPFPKTPERVKEIKQICSNPKTDVGVKSFLEEVLERWGEL